MVTIILPVGVSIGIAATAILSATVSRKRPASMSVTRRFLKAPAREQNDVLKAVRSA